MDFTQLCGTSREELKDLAKDFPGIEVYGAENLASLQGSYVIPVQNARFHLPEGYSYSDRIIPGKIQTLAVREYFGMINPVSDVGVLENGDIELPNGNHRALFAYLLYGNQAHILATRAINSGGIKRNSDEQKIPDLVSSKDRRVLQGVIDSTLFELDRLQKGKFWPWNKSRLKQIATEGEYCTLGGSDLDFVALGKDSLYRST